MAIAGVGGIGAANLNQLAQMYRQQVLTGAGDATSGAGGFGAVGGVGGVGGIGAATGPGTPAATRGADFGSAIANSVQGLESLDRTAASKAVQAATGDLKDIHDYVIAATQAQTATELTTTVRNKAIEAFNDIMRMPL